MGEATLGQLVLVRFSGDIGTKSRATRQQFVRRLIQNLRDAIASEGHPPRVRVTHNRLLVELPEHADTGALCRVFGVQSISPVEASAELELGAIVARGAERMTERVRGRRFAVRARRVGNRQRIGVSPREVENALGAALLPASAGVDLDEPEVTVGVELFEGSAYLFSERIAAEGGLPLGVEGRGLALLSGGFDSAVAAWQLLRRGVGLDYVFCNLGGATHQLGVLRVAKVLVDRWHHGHRPSLHSLDFGPAADELRAKTAPRYWQILLKRLMVRAADRIARERRAPAIVTGESVGQVSSQTLQNLAVISRASETMLLRPLVGVNKEEIIRCAERIGTFELSKVVGEYCDLAPGKPATAAGLAAVEAQEARLDLAVLDAAVAGRTIFDLRELDEEKLALPELEVTRIPEGAVVIDLRPRAAHERWHHPGCLRLDFARALRAFPSFERGQSYVLYCDFGLMSAHLAELMRREGFDATHFRGGTRALRRLSRAADAR